MVCEPLGNGAAQVQSNSHTYEHLVREPFASGLRTIRHARVYDALTLHSRIQWFEARSYGNNILSG